jgi:hypothetical protein
VGWSISLYLGEPKGEKLLYPKYRRPPDDGLYLDLPYNFECELESILGDSYGTRYTVWTEVGLSELHRQLSQKLTEREAVIIQQVLAETHQVQIETWMESLIDDRTHKDEQTQVIRQIVEMVARAQNESGTIVVSGD